MLRVVKSSRKEQPVTPECDEFCTNCRKPLEPWERRKRTSLCADCSKVWCEKCGYRHEKDFHYDEETKPLKAHR